MSNVKKSKILVYGAGTWGLALASVLTFNGHSVCVCDRNEEKLTLLSKTRVCDKFKNEKIDILIDENIKFGCKSDEHFDAIVIAVASVGFRDTICKLTHYIDDKTIIITATKGIEDTTFLTMSEIVEDVLKDKIKKVNVVALSGPSHAEEVIKKMLTNIVAASTNVDNAKFVQELFSNEYFRVYTNDDIKGVEICGAYKNIIGLASGILKGIGYGDNARAALITRSLVEMARLIEKMGAKKETLYGLAGIGDMIATATSTNSRNYNCGVLIGEGVKVETAIEKIGMVVEGIKCLQVAIMLKQKYDVSLPIMESVAKVIINGENPKDIAKLLMQRAKKSE